MKGIVTTERGERAGDREILYPFIHCPNGRRAETRTGQSQKILLSLSHEYRGLNIWAIFRWFPSE